MFWDKKTMQTARHQMSANRRPVLLPPVTPAGPVKMAAGPAIGPSKTPEHVLDAINASVLLTARINATQVR